MGNCLICTTLNEGNSIISLIESISKQTLIPDEIIIVDGGSQDNTIQIIKSTAKNLSIPVKIFIYPGVNIAKGRNLAIKHSKSNIIASTDAGSILKNDWFEKIITPIILNNKIDVVAGFWKPITKSNFEKCVVDLTFPDIHRINKDLFLPSGRSIAFKKSAWKKVKGYPEYLYTAEDTTFNLNLKKAGFNIYLEKNALVYYRPRISAKSLMKQYYLYSKGNKQAGISGINFNSYGKNSIIYVLLSIKSIIQKREYKLLLFVPYVISIIGLGKLFGMILNNGNISKFIIGGKIK